MVIVSTSKPFHGYRLAGVMEQLPRATFFGDVSVRFLGVRVNHMRTTCRSNSGLLVQSWYT